MLLTRFNPQLRVYPTLSSCLKRCISGQGPSKSSERFSITAHGSTAKNAVVAQVAGLQALGRPESSSPAVPDAAVILASREFASWLEDETFMSAFLSPLFAADGRQGATPQQTNVLSAVVDGLCPTSPHGTPTSGFSVVRGHLDTLLPSLWHPPRLAKPPDTDIRASLEVSLGPLRGTPAPLAVTVPLANTVFQNGRQSTLLAGLWEKGSEGPLRLSRLEERQTQTVGLSSGGATSASVPLVPLTAARKVLAGLGNIIRQVEVDLRPSPASKELERDIPKLLQARARSAPVEHSGPVGVWALVIPEAVATSELLSELSGGLALEPEAEGEATARLSKLVPELLASGCHIHRILSGGGGWGLKQGLLSLDPQTSYSAPDDDDIESFIRSFRGESTADGVVVPGCYVQYFVAPASIKTLGAGLAARPPPLAVFGTHSEVGFKDPAPGGPGAVTLHLGLFGAVSTHGIFLSSKPSSIQTKLDTPHSYVWEGPKA